jgi:tRNA 2-thiouridine synthesizing protein A
MRREPCRRAAEESLSNGICELMMRMGNRRSAKAREGDIVEVTGTHPSSKKEIPLAVKALGLELLEVKEEPNGIWKIRIRR